jgi:phospholipase C
MKYFKSLLCLYCILFISASNLALADPSDYLQNIVIVYVENWSFDSMFGKFPGANGLQNAEKTVPTNSAENYVVYQNDDLKRHQVFSNI